MNCERRLRRNVLFALLCGVSVSALYWGLLYTKSLHHFSLIMLLPAYEFANHCHPKCGLSVRCRLEVLVVNAAALYAFCIMIALTGLDALSLLRQKPVR